MDKELTAVIGNGRIRLRSKAVKKILELTHIGYSLTLEDKGNNQHVLYVMPIHDDSEGIKDVAPRCISENGRWISSKKIVDAIKALGIEDGTKLKGEWDEKGKYFRFEV